jgi:hypothetical protein
MRNTSPQTGHVMAGMVKPPFESMVSPVDLSAMQTGGLVFVGEEDGCGAPVSFGDYPDGGYPVVGKAVVIVGLLC